MELRRRPRRKLLTGAIGIAVLVPVTTQLVDVVPNEGNPFQQRTVDRSLAPFAAGAAGLSQYHAATAVFRWSLMSNVTLPRAVADQWRAHTFLGIGSVDVMVDFTNVDMDRG